MTRKMFRYLMLLLLFATAVLNAQSIKVNYTFIQDFKTDAVFSKEVNYELISDGVESIYYEINQKSLYDVPVQAEYEQEEIKRTVLSDNHISFSSKDKKMYYKNVEKDTLIYNTHIFNKKFIVGESLNKINWKVINKDSVILGYNTQAAKANFRGREYIAYFTTEVPIIAAPWKLDGLPGLVLYAESSDKSLRFSAYEIEIYRENFAFDKFSFEKEKVITWESYTKLLREAWVNMANKMKSSVENGESDNVKIKVGEAMEDVGFKEISL